MLYRIIGKILGAYFFAFAVILLAPLSIAVYYEFFEFSKSIAPPSAAAFFYTFLATVVSAGALSYAGRKAKGTELYRKEGLLTVVLIWFLTPAVAGLPFLINGTLDSPIQAYFEATSGLTTTGATVLAAKKYDPRTGHEIAHKHIIRGQKDVVYEFYGTVDPVKAPDGTVLAEGVEAVSRPLLFWRSFLQWLGGLGIVVLFIAILPALGVGGKVLFQAEMPGPLKETMTPRLKETAAMLWKIYLGLTFVQVVLLKWTNDQMDWLDAFAVTFSTISTGGFTMKNGSIASYHSAATEWIAAVFMLLGSINFSLYYYCLKGKFYRLYEPELIFYLILITLAGSYTALSLAGTIEFSLTNTAPSVFDWGEAVRAAFFQIISAQTSTGFAVVDYDKWPFAVQVLMLILIYMGGMSGSTAGGIKIMRLIMGFRIVQDKVELMFRPETVRSFKIGDYTVGLQPALTVLCFFMTLMAIAVASAFLLCLVDGVDPESSLAVVTSCINNSGLGFREAGPTNSFAFLNPFGLGITSVIMILGRLEFFAVLVILVPAFWKKA